MYAIETKGLTRCFGPVQALSGLDLAVPEGALYALLGVNGAGKSTAIKILTGLLPPTGGEARVLGYDVTRQREEVKKRMSLCPQDTAVAPNLTVEENLMLLAGLSGARRQDARGRTEAMLESLQLQPVAGSGHGVKIVHFIVPPLSPYYGPGGRNITGRSPGTARRHPPA